MMKYFKKITIYFYAIFCLLNLNFNSAIAATPITTDNRIKTYVYNENEVYNLLIHYGYQSNIEFGIGEEVETISVGDSYAWKINPIGRRLFIKPMEENIHTNMTVITNKRTYQFDIMSRAADDKIDKELVYVVKFFYPDKNDYSQKDDQDNNE